MRIPIEEYRDFLNADPSRHIADDAERQRIRELEALTRAASALRYLLLLQGGLING